MTTATTKPRKPTLAARLAAAEAERDAWRYVATMPAVVQMVRSLVTSADNAIYNKRPIKPGFDVTLGHLKRYLALVDANKGEGR